MNRYTLWTLFGPQAWSLWLMALAMIALFSSKPRPRPLARWCLGLALGWSLAMYCSPLGTWLIEPLESRFPVPRSVAGATDILVLTGGEHLAASARHHQAEYGETGDRMVMGAMLAHALPGARLWAVGGVRSEPGAPRDIDWMHLAWTELGVDPRRIALIGDTEDTCQNARGLAARLGAGRRPVLVTSAFHMPRAVGCFRAAGLAVLPYPADFVNGAGLGLFEAGSINIQLNAWRTDVALHEYAGLLYYRLTGRIGALWPGPVLPP